MLPFVCMLVLSVATVFGGDEWQGGWFPYSPDTVLDPNPALEVRQNLYDPLHGVVMGLKNPHCDDGKSNLELDWDLDPTNHSCFSREFFQPKSDKPALYSSDFIPTGYSPIHHCMNQKIEYGSIIPTYGPHRPLWAKYGEYTFLPKQRWVHNLEHGAIVMLYHPCANKNEVNILRNLVKKCLYRHIITPYNLLSPERPLALVSWGHKIEMSKVSPEIVMNFIKEHALKGPEEISRDGQFNFLLEKHAEIISDLQDSKLCQIFNNYIE